MTCKDYELIAYQLWLVQPVVGNSRDATLLWNALVQNMAMAFQRENDKFNAGKFIEACENGLDKWK